MSVITEALTGDPWELAKVVRRLGRRCMELGRQHEEAHQRAALLLREREDCQRSYRAAVLKLEESLIAPGPHEAGDARSHGAVSITATEVLAQQGKPWPRGFDELRRTAVEQRDQILGRGENPDQYVFLVTSFEAKTIQEACGSPTCSVRTLAGLALRVVDGAELDSGCPRGEATNC